MLVNLCQIEIKITDIVRSRTFYEQVFGLKLVPAEIHNYHILEVSKKSSFGISLLEQEKVEPNRSMILYFRLESLEGIKEKLGSLRNGSFKGERIVPGYGRAIFVEDPDGHRLGLFVPLK
ncbi:MAG: VOC family protein [Oligoflexales bacterium]